jgi:aspartate-semialdehyde dehydrogenase
MIETLEKRNFPVKDLRLFASERSVGKKLKFKGQEIAVELLTADCWNGIDIALFSAGASRSREFAAPAVKAGAVVIDNSSAFRMDPDVPLVVPEVNPEDIKDHKGIIANPNCTTIIMLVVVKPLHDISPVKRIVVSTYQSISGAGAQALAELEDQTRKLQAGEEFAPSVLPYQVAFNLFSHNSGMTENGYVEEEMKMVHETRKMLHDDSIQVCPTCIRVPIPRAHSEAMIIEQERQVSVEEAMEALDKAPGVQLIDDRENNRFPMPTDVTGQYDVAVGRVRYDISAENSLALFCCGDQLLKGAALNAVQIAELL